MKEIIKKVNEVAGQIGKKTEPIMKKTEEMVEIQKIKSQIRSLENHNEYDLCDLGEIVFAKYKDELVQDEDFVAICEEIEQRLEAIENLEFRIAEMKGLEICKNCEMALTKGVSYCSNCGAKIERPVIEEEKPEVEETIFEEGDVVEILETEDAEIEIEFVVEPAEVETMAEVETVAEVKEATEVIIEEVVEAEEKAVDLEEDSKK